MNIKKILGVVFFIALFAFTTNSFGQSLEKYEYAEIIVLQKVAKNESEIKEVYLNSTTDTSLDKEEISKIKSNPELMKYMNSSNWELIDRLGSQPSNSGPIWISYTYRKKQ